MFLSQCNAVQTWGLSKGTHETIAARVYDLGTQVSPSLPSSFGHAIPESTAFISNAGLGSDRILDVKPCAPMIVVTSDSNIDSAHQQIDMAYNLWDVYGERTKHKPIPKPAAPSAPMIKDGSGHFIGGYGNMHEQQKAVAYATNKELDARDGMMGVSAEFSDSARQQLVIPDRIRSGDDQTSGVTSVRVN